MTRFEELEVINKQIIDTREYYGGTYPEPLDEEEQEKVSNEEYEAYMADVYYEEMMIGESL